VILIVCRDAAATQRRFGLVDGGIGICYTRTGRLFFADQAMEDALLAHVQSALTYAGFWEAFETDWVYLDGEGIVVNPWTLSPGAGAGWCSQPSNAAGASTCASSMAPSTQLWSTWRACVNGISGPSERWRCANSLSGSKH
jgi:hypothetical protein